MEYTNPYYYYSKNDPSKESIDKVLAYNEDHAIEFFADRKKMDKETFTKLYNVEIYVKTKSK